MSELVRVHSILKAQNSMTDFSRTFNDLNLLFSSTKIIDKKPYPRCGASKFTLQYDTEVYCTGLINTVMIQAGDRCHHRFVCKP